MFAMPYQSYLSLPTVKKFWLNDRNVFLDFRGKSSAKVMTRKFRQKTDSANFQQNTAFRRCSGKLVLQNSWNCPRKIPSRVKDQEHSTENVLKTSSFKVVFIKFFKNLLKALIPEPLHTAPTTFKVREIHPLTVFHIKDSANTNPNE